VEQLPAFLVSVAGPALSLELVLLIGLVILLNIRRMVVAAIQK
jgi:hypothetical protein